VRIDRRWTQTPKWKIYKRAYDREWRAKPEIPEKKAMFVIDCAEDYSKQGASIQKLGAAGIIRYFNPLTNGKDSGKSLTPAEAKRWKALGMPVGVVVEGYGLANGTGVDGPSGTRDARGVLAWLPTVGLISPRVVWFAVDTDASAAQINNNEVAYFDSIRRVFGSFCQIGIYGSGWSCMSMVGTKRADKAWVAGSPGWAHYRDYVNAGGWTLLQKIYPGEKWNGFNADTDTLAPGVTLASAGLLVPFQPFKGIQFPGAGTQGVGLAPPASQGHMPEPTQSSPVAKPPGFIKSLLDGFRRM